MGKERASKPAKHCRCRVVLNIRFNEEERGISLGPGSVITGELYAELMERNLASPEFFEEVRDDGDVLTPASEE